MHYLKIFLFVPLLILANTIDSANWDYGNHGPDVWMEMFPACGGKKQSPINIRTRCTVYQAFELFNFTSIHYEQIKFKLTNNGHTIIAAPNSPTKITLTGGKLQGTYNFEGFHIHWGPNHNSGSEHQV
ncbi:unnamed protein product [Rotaria sp. Silwood2]|nr:unnamed protein product [Rotaria sp. Silwood2]